MQIQESDLESLLENKEYIIGADECGYGSLAGNVTVCAFKAAKNWNLVGLNDSKKLTSNKRAELSEKLKVELFYIAQRDNDFIDKYGIAVSLKEAYIEAFNKLYDQQSLIIVDGILKFENLSYSNDIKSLIKADCKIATVMAASIIGKHNRDCEMIKLHESYIQYDFKSNKGYGSKNHKDAIKQYGLSDLHRKSYNIKF